MHTLILTPDGVGSTILQRLITIHLHMNNKKVLFKTKDGQDNSIISFEKIRTLRYQKKSLQLRTTGVIVGSAIYALWGYLQSSHNYENYGEENGQKKGG